MAARVKKELQRVAHSLHQLQAAQSQVESNQGKTFRIEIEVMLICQCLKFRLACFT